MTWNNEHWHNIDTVLLDMDGTLLDLHFDNFFWLHHLPTRYAQAHNISFPDARDLLMERIKALEGSLQWYCVDYWSDALSMDIRALKEEIKHKIQIRPHVPQFLQRLKALQKKLVLITNAHPKSLQLKLQVTEIDQWLDLVLSSHQFQQPKERQEFWQQLQVHEHFDPERTLFIDDTPRILQSAQTFGIKYLLCIQQPDSQIQRPQVDEFPCIHHFDEIMPPTSASTAGGRAN